MCVPRFTTLKAPVPSCVVERVLLICSLFDFCADGIIVHDERDRERQRCNEQRHDNETI